MKGFYFRKAIHLLPGVRLNISKKGMSLSVGPHGAHVTTGSRGTYLNLDLPGSGAYYRKKLDAKETDEKTDQSPETSPLDVNFLQRLTIPFNELDLLDALRALHEGQEDKCYDLARRATHLADGAFLAGFIAFKHEQFGEAVEFFKQALQHKEDLGQIFGRYEVDMAIDIPITPEIGVHIQPNENDILIALAEAYERGGARDSAIEILGQLYERDPEDIVVRLSLAELLDQRNPDSQEVQQRIVQLAEDVHNESAIHAALMFYRARALRKLNLLEGARDTVIKALRRKKDYPSDLLLALHYERALIYEAMGQSKQAREEFQKVYAEAPSYEDVAAKLGL
jgi:tetratricopeptide (TPR) repeat protein